MLPSNISQYLPHAGLFLILLGIIFSIVAVADYPTKSSRGDIASASKYTTLAYALIIAGGFVLIGPFH